MAFLIKLRLRELEAGHDERSLTGFHHPEYQRKKSVT